MTRQPSPLHVCHYSPRGASLVEAREQETERDYIVTDLPSFATTTNGQSMSTSTFLASSLNSPLPLPLYTSVASSPSSLPKHHQFQSPKHREREKVLSQRNSSHSSSSITHLNSTTSSLTPSTTHTDVMSTQASAISPVSSHSCSSSPDFGVDHLTLTEMLPVDPPPLVHSSSDLYLYAHERNAGLSTAASSTLIKTLRYAVTQKEADDILQKKRRLSEPGLSASLFRSSMPHLPHHKQDSRVAHLHSSGQHPQIASLQQNVSDVASSAALVFASAPSSTTNRRTPKQEGTPASFSLTCSSSPSSSLSSSTSYANKFVPPPVVTQSSTIPLTKDVLPRAHEHSLSHSLAQAISLQNFQEYVSVATTNIQTHGFVPYRLLHPEGNRALASFISRRKRESRRFSNAGALMVGLPRSNSRLLASSTSMELDSLNLAAASARAQEPSAADETSAKSPPLQTHDGHRRLLSLTAQLPEFFFSCSSSFHYSRSNNPRRTLTEPNDRCLNNGFDNIQSNLVISVDDVLHSDTGEFRSFRVLEMLGEGTFGQVVKCEDCSTHKFRAIKVIKNKPAYFNQALTEIKLLTVLNHDYDRDDQRHLLRLLDHFTYKHHLCLVFELLSVNLYELIKQNRFHGLSMHLIRTFLKQLVEALNVLRRAGIIHCDLKPENVLLKELSLPQIKLIDFGSACFESQTVYSYIQSRFYRSPEVLLGLPYSCMIDMWSLGCIAAELFLGVPIFPGATQHNQIERIVRFIGPPPNTMLDSGKTVHKFFYYQPMAAGQNHWSLKSAAVYAEETKTAPVANKAYFKGDTLAEVIDLYPIRKSLTTEQISQEREDRDCFLHFLQGLLRWDPQRRWTPAQTAQHPFLTKQSWRHFDENAFEKMRHIEMGLPSSSAVNPSPLLTQVAPLASAFQPSSIWWTQRGRAQSWSQQGSSLVCLPSHSVVGSSSLLNSNARVAPSHPISLSSAFTVTPSTSVISQRAAKQKALAYQHRTSGSSSNVNVPSNEAVNFLRPPTSPQSRHVATSSNNGRPRPPLVHTPSSPARRGANVAFVPSMNTSSPHYTLNNTPQRAYGSMNSPTQQHLRRREIELLDLNQSIVPENEEAVFPPTSWTHSDEEHTASMEEQAQQNSAEWDPFFAEHPDAMTHALSTNTSPLHTSAPLQRRRSSQMFVSSPLSHSQQSSHDSTGSSVRALSPVQSHAFYAAQMASSGSLSRQHSASNAASNSLPWTAPQSPYNRLPPPLIYPSNEMQQISQFSSHPLHAVSATHDVQHLSAGQTWYNHSTRMQGVATIADSPSSSPHASPSYSPPGWQPLGQSGYWLSSPPRHQLIQHTGAPALSSPHIHQPQQHQHQQQEKRINFRRRSLPVGHSSHHGSLPHSLHQHYVGYTVANANSYPFHYQDEPMLQQIVPPGMSMPQPSVPMILQSPHHSSGRVFYGPVQAGARWPVHLSSLVPGYPASFTTPNHSQAPSPFYLADQTSSAHY